MMLLGRSIPWFRTRKRATTKVCVAAAGLAAMILGAPKTAQADITSDKVEFFGYGRMGIGWTKSGQQIAGKYMNLNPRSALGGRLEEGDYLEPGIRYHLKKGEKDTDTKVDFVSSMEMYSTSGAILSSLSNGETDALKIFPEQAYIQAKNVFTPGLEIWLGSRLYRKNDIHIADYFYFNRLNGQGVGAIYTHPKLGEIDVAILQQTGSTNFFRVNAGSPTAPDYVQRVRTMFIAQYKIPFGPATSFVQALGEFHVVPRSQRQDIQFGDNVNPPDWGAVGGAKLHLDLGGKNFYDVSFRYGNRIANGAESGGATYNTFGVAAFDGTYKGAYGVEIVNHFLWEVDRIVGVNAYFVAHYSIGARDFNPIPGSPDAAANSRSDYAFGVRPTIYVHDNFHVLTEATYQTRKDEGNNMGTAVKLSIAPTIVPTGDRNSFARPHIRLIYTSGWYNKAAQDQAMSPFLQAVGPTTFAHYLGFRTEWWY